MTPCPCCSRKEYSMCCGPLLAGRPAPTAEALMRSRYTAYSVEDFAYIEQTCAGEAALAFNREEAARSAGGTEWLGLTIEATTGGAESDTTGTVTFTARYRQHGRLAALSETSEFRRIMGAWRYIRGDVTLSSKKAPALQIGRNDPCLCGSGRKYKKCCGVGIA